MHPGDYAACMMDLQKARLSGHDTWHLKGWYKTMKSDATQFIGEISDQALKGANAADKAVRKTPYKIISLAATAGAVAGFFIGRRCSHRDAASR